MWTRSDLKNRAKDRLRINYWMGFLICLILGILGGDNSGGAAQTLSNGAVSAANYSTPVGHGAQYIALLFVTVFAVAAVASVIVVVIVVFITNPLMVGGKRFFLAGREVKAAFGELGFAFSDQYMNVVGIMFLRDLFTFLWTLVFIIPGIVKSYEYRMIPYILAENPTISRQRAFELSREMTMGHKWDMFVLDLSFLLWYLGGALLCGIGTLFVNPYPAATEEELYAVLRNNVLSQGITNTYELPGVL